MVTKPHCIATKGRSGVKYISNLKELSQEAIDEWKIKWLPKKVRRRKYGLRDVQTYFRITQFS